MANEIKMPQLSDTMHSGKILTWRKNVGDQVARGDILAEVETDKANLEIEAFSQGVLLKIATPAGAVANVGDIIAYIGQAGESVDGGSSSNGASSPKPRAATQPVQLKSDPVAFSAKSTAAPVIEATSSNRIKASPLARKIARERNIDINQVTGSGPAGRIVKKDIEDAATTINQRPVATKTASNVAPIRPAAAIEQRGTPTSGGKLVPLSKMRETIARRMQESVTESPHFYVTASVNMGEAKKLREVLKGTPGYEGISFNHLIIKAVAYALSREPRVNRAMRDGMQFEPESINIGIITALEDGLIIPVLHKADTLSLRDTVFEAKAAVERARAGRPTAQDLSGGTFSISNMGMYDVDSFTAIINPGQGGVLAVSAIKDEPVIVNGVVVPGSTMKATVSVDHRVIDGAMAGNFMKHFKQALEIPALLMA